MLLLNSSISPSLMMQYVIVATIIAAAILWIIVKNINRKNKNAGGCSGCALSEACNSKRNKESESERCSDKVTKKNQAEDAESGAHDE